MLPTTTTTTTTTTKCGSPQCVFGLPSGFDLRPCVVVNLPQKESRMTNYTLDHLRLAYYIGGSAKKLTVGFDVAT